MGTGSTRQMWKPVLGNVRPRRRPGGIYQHDELQELIMYEKARADRTGDELSVVLCDVTRLNGDKYLVGGIIRELTTGVRATDHVGWYNRCKLGVVLPLTSRCGAEQFVRNLDMNGTKDMVRFRVYSYPDQWLGNQNGKSEPELGNGCDDGDQKESTGSTSGTPASARLQTVAPFQPTGSEQNNISFTRSVPTWKRALDITGGLIGLILLAPFLALVALYIKIVSPGPVLFKQKRIGLARQEFMFYKFRTMHHNNNETVHSHHAKDFIAFDKPMTKLDGVDPRIIRGGRILRKLAIDELPQLLNIVKGDMSLVGPRPCIPYEADEYLQWHARRFSILPGLTGLWQVSGKNKLTFQQMIRLDIAYETKMSFWFDLAIILRTFPTVVQLGLEGAKRRIRLRTDKFGDETEDTSAYVAEPAEARVAK